MRNPSQQVELVFNKKSPISSDKKLTIDLVEAANNSSVNIRITRKLELTEEMCVKAKYLVINCLFISILNVIFIHIHQKFRSFQDRLFLTLAILICVKKLI